MTELRFTTAQDYLNYDWDDNFGFFFEEIQSLYKSVELIDPDMLLGMDPNGEIRKMVNDLFLIYDALIIDLQKEILLGEINKTRFVIKRS